MVENSDQGLYTTNQRNKHGFIVTQHDIVQ